MLTPARAARSRASSRDGFYGWRIVALAGLALGMTAPGQTAGVSVFVDHLINDLGITRSALSSAYLVGTLVGASALPMAGRAIDRWGVRTTMTLIVAAFGFALVGASRVAGIVTLTAAFVGIRMLGQGSLSLAATTSVAFWFDRRRGTAVGISTATGQGLMSLAPVVLTAGIVAIGWRNTWVVAGAVVLLVLVPLSGLVMRDGPAALGQLPDGDHRTPDASSAPRADAWGMERREAMRTGIFWTITAAMASSAMIGTGMAFHQISLLGERGFTPTQAAAVFVPLTVAGITATILVGWLADRVHPRGLLIFAMLTLAAGMVVVQHVEPGWAAMLYAGALGGSVGAGRAIEGAVVPRLFGTRRLGSIRATVMTVTVGATAFGPVALAVGAERLGGYPAILNLLLALPAAAILAALVCRVPAVPAQMPAQA